METGLFILIGFAWVFAIGAYLYVKYTDRKSERTSSTK
jgi:hypothetical protein